MIYGILREAPNELRIEAAEGNKSKRKDKVPPHLSELN
jgi:hypothetical protein